jgi:hypothetical protein
MKPPMKASFVMNRSAALSTEIRVIDTVDLVLHG